jgi:ligand-binding sensor domain-containing protein
MWDLIFNSVVYNNKTVNDIEVVGNNIFIGTVDSIVKINEKTGLVKEFNFPFIGRVNHIKIIEDNLWAGTNNGLIKFRWKASL